LRNINSKCIKFHNFNIVVGKGGTWDPPFS
jgi:hypothetical protein